ncbi:polysaccharide biosynthesis/export family protein [Sphingopyxis granuli]|jgi:polysaccharide export outer membrane protein|uniref:polysaccharide biosynthesis/export family protein n=1 Tax=Sphingopyxis granuli TaxID=267128 RepID=UPI000A8E1CE5|nr:polysaccharide biosynthesis/export family protein [Sphingopyxis granuli]
MKHLRSALAFSVMLLAGCGGTPAPVASIANPPVTALTELPQPSADDGVRASRVAFIGPFTELRVEVFGVPDMQRDIMTDGKGGFTFPLVGELDAGGKTTDVIAEEIRSKLAGRYVRDPQVTVNFKSPTTPFSLQSMSVIVDGQVEKSGAYPVVGRVTLMRAVALAGGTTEYAKMDDVVIFRTVEGKEYAGLYNLGAIQRGNYADPEVFPNDVIIVGDSPQRRRMRDLLQSVPALLSPIILLASELRR